MGTRPRAAACFDHPYTRPKLLIKHPSTKDVRLLVATSALNGNNVCLLFLLHCTCHVSITHSCTENRTFVFSFICMCDIIWPPAPFKICYLARTLKELHEPGLEHDIKFNSAKSNIMIFCCKKDGYPHTKF